MTHSRLTAFLAAALLLGGVAFAADAPYLAPSAEPDATKYLSAFPTDGTPEMAADQAAFKKTRTLQNSARWSLAIADVSKKPSDVAGDFSCAVGTKLDAATAPHLIALIARMQKDASGVSGPAKGKYKRTRPFVGNDAPICEERTAENPNDSYPSGHTTMIWSVGLMLAHIAPDRAGPILARTRAYGESRVVCGVHWASDVEAGRLAGGITFQALEADSAFQADMEAARKELADARAKPMAPDKGRCIIENAAAAKRPW
jgi:acid phosphatase (class A)